MDFFAGKRTVSHEVGIYFGLCIFVLFCTSKYGWGWNNFIKEANTGIGPKFPEGLRGYMTYVLPVIIAVILVMGYIQFFG